MIGPLELRGRFVVHRQDSKVRHLFNVVVLSDMYESFAASEKYLTRYLVGWLLVLLPLGHCHGFGVISKYRTQSPKPDTHVLIVALVQTVSTKQ